MHVYRSGFNGVVREMGLIEMSIYLYDDVGGLFRKGGYGSQGIDMDEWIRDSRYHVFMLVELLGEWRMAL